MSNAKARLSRFHGISLAVAVLLVALLVPAALASLAAQGKVIAYSYTNIDFPGALITFAFGLNDQGTQIVGNYVDSNFDRHGFLLSDGSFSTIDFPGGTFSNSANNINNRGQIVGQYADSGGVHGYLLADGIFTTIDFPGAVE